MKKVLALILCLLLLLPQFPACRGAETGGAVDLSALIDDPVRRHFVEGMIGYALRYDPAVKATLEEGYIALFFFEGCSDNMNDALLSDISYYRVSAVCVAVKRMEDGTPGILYFNGNCSTLPDRPLEYGKKKMADIGDVGPATVMDGTYELYSVKHNGAYEALHIQTSGEDETVAAVYMTPEGYVNAQASQINIHTRTGNHVIEKAMWSAGCLLVGDGDFGAFADLVQSTYYASYDAYEKDQFVGTVTINRQMLKEELYALYENRDAVDMLLSASRRTLPEKYLARCTDQTLWEAQEMRMALTETSLMTLPCSSATDPRSVPVVTLPLGEEFPVLGTIVNSQGNLWYITQWEGEQCYVFSGYAGEIPEPVAEEPEPREENLWQQLLHWLNG